ncbi:DUF3465 domain-containing protein [Psychromonas sp.]|uniref:DUF3465 domain-containing protein n=1 Tax=Psychromonas sp. TaxID=1884585 RepID=UPI0035677100
MKKILIILLVIVGIYQWLGDSPNKISSLVNEVSQSENAQSGNNAILKRAFENRQSDVQVQGEGIVKQLLADDLQGSRHQRFILQLPSGQTLLIAHNIDLAPKISALSKGDQVQFYGEYEWNQKGGVVHWTHKDPNGRHIHGWLKHNGKTYQ